MPNVARIPGLSAAYTCMRMRRPYRKRISRPRLRYPRRTATDISAFSTGCWDVEIDFAQAVPFSNIMDRDGKVINQRAFDLTLALPDKISHISEKYTEYDKTKNNR